jgi:hypothetical protein
MSAQTISDSKAMFATAREHGFFVLKGFFDPARVRKVRAELDQLFDADLSLRSAKGLPVTHKVDGVTYELTNMIHTILFPSILNAAFAQMWDEIFEHPDVKEFLKRIAGENIQMRVDLVRRSTGVNDTIDEFQIPHNWHRDTNGEFTLGIFFDDLSKRYSGGTIAIPGTHWTPFDPIWDFVIGNKSYTNKVNYLKDECVWLPDDLAKKALANRQYEATLKASPVEMCGTFGDIYFFFNDVYHGRAPNHTGGKLMMSRLGGFSAAFDFKDDIQLPNFPAGYPQSLIDVYAKKPKFKRDSTFLLGEMDAARKGQDLQHIARIEKMLLVREVEEKHERAKLEARTKSLESELASLKEKLAARPMFGNGPGAGGTGEMTPGAIGNAVASKAADVVSSGSQMLAGLNSAMPSLQRQLADRGARALEMIKRNLR